MAKSFHSLQKSPLGKVKGHGSGKAGTSQFISQRGSAALLAVLLVWFAYAAIFQIDGTYESATAFLANPLQAAGVLALILVAVVHLRLGLMEIIHDYLHRPITRFSLILLINFGCVLGVLVSIVAVAKIFAGA